MQELNDEQVLTVIRMGMDAYGKQETPEQVVPPDTAVADPKKYEEAKTSDSAGRDKNGSV